jgi:hypothetical protein
MAEGTRSLGLLGSAQIPTAERLEDFDPKVLPILAANGEKGRMFAIFLHKFGKSPVDDDKYTWYDEPHPEATSTVTTTATAASGTSLRVGVGHGKRFPRWAMVWNENKNEHAQVTLNDGTDILTIRKPAFAGEGNSQWDIGDRVVVVGLYPPDGSGPTKMWANNPVLRENFIAYLERTVEITERLKLNKNQKTGDEYQRLTMMAMLKLMQDIELALTVGLPGAAPEFVSSADQYIYPMKGMLAHIPANRKFTSSYGGTSPTGTLSATTFKEFATLFEEIFQYGNESKVMFTHPSAMTRIHRMALNVTLQLEPVSSEELVGKKNVGGLNLKKLAIGGKSLVLVPMPLWKEHGILANHGIVVDPQFVRLVYKGPGGILARKNIVQDGSTAFVDKVCSYFGLKMTNGQAHAIVNVPAVA